MKIKAIIDSEDVYAIQAQIEQTVNILSHPDTPGNPYQAKLSNFDIEYSCKNLASLLKIRESIRNTREIVENND
jgi:hypothetical protein